MFFSTLSSSFSVSVPLSSQRSNGVMKSPRPNFLPMRRSYSNNNSIHAMSAAEGRDNLDHLQRPGRVQQGQPKKKAPQAAPIGLWDRFPNARTVQQMMETMESLIEDPLAYNNTWSSSPLPRDDISSYRRGRTPWEIKEVEKEYKLRFDMPGMTKSDVKVWVEEKMLVVKAEKMANKKEGSENGGGEEDGAEWSSKSYGKYSSRIALPENVDFGKIKAEVRDGVLYITIPKVSISSKVLDINVQ